VPIAEPFDAAKGTDGGVHATPTTPNTTNAASLDMKPPGKKEIDRCFYPLSFELQIPRPEIPLRTDGVPTRRASPKQVIFKRRRSK
jgi:hypothetical protein